MSKTAKDLTAGTAGGICQVMVGQPFDMVKKRMQTAPPGTYSGAIQCATGILKNEGPLAFYKGTLTPLLGIGVCVSIQFGALEAAKRYFRQQNELSGLGNSLTSTQLMIAGAFAGVSNGFVSGPVEHIRIRLQTQPDKARLYYGPLDAMRKIVGNYGIAGLYKGQTATFTREASGYGVYFLAYEQLVQKWMRDTGRRRDELSPVRAVAYGAAAGYALWAVIYPIDVVKSRLQTDAFSGPERKYNGTLDCVRKVWAREGVKGFTRGLGPTLVRSPFANGATFLGFELMSRALASA
ncbi:mitochondrial carrier [Clavulina sp. PMI_390]|nr:mitochondrial carrier [Clavulina sp. PMI_390]